MDFSEFRWEGNVIVKGVLLLSKLFAGCHILAEVS